MKKKNINYGSLAERGIKKAWDKACVYEYDNNENEFRLVLFYAGKPFESLSVKDPFDVELIRKTINSAIDFYSGFNVNYRMVSKRFARLFLKLDAGEKLVTYRNGGVLIQNVKMAVRLEKPSYIFRDASEFAPDTEVMAKKDVERYVRWLNEEHKADIEELNEEHGAEMEAQAMRLIGKKNVEIESLKAKIRELGGNA